MEQVLYAQVLVLCRKDLEFTEANKNKNESKFNFQSESAISQYWFYIDFDWIQFYFSTREPDFYGELFHSHGNTQDTNKFKIFQVPIGNSKCVEFFKIHGDAQMLKYCQKLLNGCFFSGL